MLSLYYTLRPICQKAVNGVYHMWIKLRIHKVADQYARIQCVKCACKIDEVCIVFSICIQICRYEMR